MTAPANRRWSRFTLRTLFVVVTLGAVVAWLFFPSSPVIIGKVSRSDVAAICQAVHSSDKNFGKPIRVIELLAPGKVKVQTWEVSGPLSGGGFDLFLEKQNGVWIVVNYEMWIG